MRSWVTAIALHALTSMPAVALHALLSIPATARACATIDAQGAMRIADQEVLIVFDHRTRTEHFVRRAEFDATRPGADFGFLVPTPTVPEIALADGAVFERLDALSAPKHERDYDIQWSLLAHRARGHGATHLLAEDKPTRSATVLSRTHVAGYDVVVLDAEAPEALATWLAENRFPIRPETLDWVRPYVTARWKITAFHYNPAQTEAATAAVTTPAVRMTFSTDRPLFPARVPQDNRTGRALLRLFYVGTDRAAARTEHGDVAWHAKNTFADDLGEHLAPALAGAIPAPESIEHASWLTVFEDRRWPSSDADLYFGSAPVQASIFPPPVIDVRRVWLPLELLLPLGIVIGFVLRKRRNLRSNGGPAGPSLQTGV